MEEFFPQNENLKTVLCRPIVKKSQNCEIFFWGYDGHTITRAEFTGMMDDDEMHNGLLLLFIGKSTSKCYLRKNIKYEKL